LVGLILCLLFGHKTMTYCLNCLQSNNPNDAKFCQRCGNPLLLQERYRPIKTIGQGGFGKTFQAVDEGMPRKPICVIKQFAPQGQGDIQKAIQLFEQEALRLVDLGKHESIPTLFAHCTQNGQQYIVQEFIDGQNLAEELETQGIWNEEKILALLGCLLPLLEFIHRNDIIHRDIKPENIIRRQGGSNDLVLVDFGAAKHATGTALLRTGTSIGSAEYVSPEQARGKAVLASDIYSLGVTCIHLLTGLSPFDLMDLDGLWIWRDYIPANSVTERLAKILDKAIAPSVSQRYQFATEVLADLNLTPTVSTNPAPTAEPIPNYQLLEKLLAEKCWKEADELTRTLILKESGGLLYIDNDTVTRIPSATLNRIDRLWTNYSDGRFGFTAQKQIFDDLNQDGTAFVVKVGWRGKATGFFAGFTWKEYANLMFMLGAPAGHLPVLIAGAVGGVATDQAARVLYNAFNSPGVLNHFFAHLERCRLEQ
jgi:serine/threonine protein kinase